MPQMTTPILAMNRTEFTALWVLLTVLIFVGMWWGWRARTRRDSETFRTAPAHPLGGDVIAQFARVGYVSTTLETDPFERLAIPGLRYKGWADVTVHCDGVEIAVVGESPVQIDAARVRGVASASSRVGKGVEPGGLALLRWVPPTAMSTAPERVLESAFRFAERAQQQAFGLAIERISTAEPHTTSAPEAGATTTTTTQEDA